MYLKKQKPVYMEWDMNSIMVAVFTAQLDLSPFYWLEWSPVDH